MLRPTDYRTEQRGVQITVQGVPTTFSEAGEELGFDLKVMRQLDALIAQALDTLPEEPGVTGVPSLDLTYAEVLPEEQHRATGKGAGQTNHVERFNNVLRQRLGRLVRRTLSFSKSDVMHEACLLLFLHEHNQPTRHKPRIIRLH